MHDLRVEVDKARKYLEQSFGSGDTPPIAIYWGTAADFLHELREQLAKTADDEAPPAVEDEDDWIS